ncbi:MAG: Gfo/Idh/MocA family oxidoreductase [Clostridia bacterium]|nr:Gfo/Idh/MocA family oxidoreductase [Clostridia bacterium]
MKKNLVVVGYGGMGGGFHAKKALTSDVVNLLGIYDIDEKKNELARANGIYAYSSLDEVLADERVDIVTVAVPNDSHKEIVIRALEAGKSVICEKPVAMSLAELDEMIAAANKSGNIFSVHQNRRFDVDYLAIKKIVGDGKIGKPLRIESRIHGSRGIPSDWRGEKEHGGGMILDWGVHLIDQLLQIFNEPIKSIYCTVTNITNKEVDDGFYLTITFASGAEAFIEVGTYNFIPLPRFYMKAEKGSAIITDWRECAKVVKCKYWHESEVIPVETAAGLTKTMAPRDAVTVEEWSEERPQSDVHDYYRNFCAAMDGKETQMVTHPEMRTVMRVMELAFASAQAGEPVPYTE